MNINNNKQNQRVKGSYGMLKGDMFTIPGTFQSSLPPRFSNVGYSPSLRYQMPSSNHLATPPNHPFIYEHPSFTKKNYDMKWNNRQC
jgi:hypothetical protein